MATPENQWKSPEPALLRGSQSGGPASRNQQWGFAALILWLLGFIGSGIGGHELLTSLRCGKSPSRINCAELVHRGPPGSDFVTLTNFTPKLDGYIYWLDEQGRWETADVPLVANGELTPRVIVRVGQPQNEAHLRDALSGAELTGVISGRGLSGESSAMLASYNPGMDPGTCWIMTLNARPHDKGMLSLVFVGGIALFTISIWMFVEKHQPSAAGQPVSPHISPLLILVDGLHVLANWLPLPDRRVCGAVLLPFAVSAAVYGGYLFLRLSAPQTVTQIGAEFLAIGALDLGVAFTFVALSFLLVERSAEA